MLMTGIIIAALVIFLISTDLTWSNVLSSQRNALVFENRVKEYGAFMLRKEEPRNMAWALLFGCTLFVSGGLALKAAHNASAELPSLPTEMVTPYVLPPMDDDLPIEKPKQDKQQLEESEPVDPAPERQGIDNASPVVVEDQITDPLLTQDEMANQALGGNGELGDPAGGPMEAGSGGSGTENGDGSSGEKLWTWAPVMPAFPGGEEELRRYLRKHLVLTEFEREIGVNGTLYFTFVVRKNGEIENVELVRGIRGADQLQERAARVLKQMPLWSPGRNGDQVLDVRFSIPIKIIVNQ